MTTYKLHYFDAEGLGELPRLLLAAAHQEYEDIRYQRGAEWQEAKKRMPHGTVPVLEVIGDDGVLMLSQSFAIAKFLARTFRFNGKDSKEEARIDEVIEQTRDLAMDLIMMRLERDEGKKADLAKGFQSKLPTLLGKLEGALKANNGGTGFIVGTGITLADIHVYQFLCDWVPHQPPAELPPLLKDLLGRVEENPGIRDWLAKRQKAKK
ncbi:glutathione S-transferase-like [Lineus longissimus]|uniref:glutathione S-transferase-like n=1 Tax=Lineus longissimus TaxID=88925 RepID=UPI002B4C2DA5